MTTEQHRILPSALHAKSKCGCPKTNACTYCTCRVRLLFLDELKLVPLVLGSDPLLPQHPADMMEDTLSFIIIHYCVVANCAHISLLLLRETDNLRPTN